MDLRENLCLSEDTTVEVDQENISDVLPQLNNQDYSQKLRIARDLLLIFVQENFVGCRREQVDSQDQDHRASLCVDSEQLNVNVRNPELLHSAKKIFCQECSTGARIEVLVWKLRATVIHQHVLDERTGSLYKEFQGCVAELDSVLEKEEVFVRACVTLEIVQGYILFRRITEAGLYLKKVKELLKTQLKLVSMLGFRTRFQTKPLPQLALKVITAEEDLPKSSVSHSATELPKLLLLEDDTRLEKVKFVNEAHGEIADLAGIIQCLIITEM